MGKQAVHLVKTSGLVMLCLLVGACNQENTEEPATTGASGSDRCEAAVKEVIGLELTGPDTEVTRMKQEVEDMMADFEEEYGELVQHPGYMESGPETDAFFAYVNETYRSYFTEKGFVEFVNVDSPNVFRFHQNNLEYRMEPTSINVQKVEMEDTDQEFSAFDFTAEVYYSTRREGDVYDFAGWALCTPEGKISHLTIIDRDELAEKMMNEGG